MYGFIGREVFKKGVYIFTSDVFNQSITVSVLDWRRKHSMLNPSVSGPFSLVLLFRTMWDFIIMTVEFSFLSSFWTSNFIMDEPAVFVRTIEWDMMDKTKFFPLSMLSSFCVRASLYPLTLIKTRLQVQKHGQMYRGKSNRSF